MIYNGTYPSGLIVKEDNAIVDGADISNPKGVGLKITGNNVTVRNSVIHDTKDHGVLFLGTSGGILENCEIHHAAMRNRPNTISGGWPSLVKVQSVDESPTGLAHDIIIRNNYIHDGYGEGMGLRGSNIRVHGNVVKNCYSFGIYSNSDHTHIEGNFVLADNPHYFRAGWPMAGIGGAEESFKGWGAHGHDTHTVINNIVVGTKYGYRYGRSTNKKGLVDTIIAFNTFSQIVAAAISVTYYPNQRGIGIHHNLVNKGVSVKGAEIVGNVVKNTEGKEPSDFAVQSEPANKVYLTPKDFFQTERAIYYVGAIEYDTVRVS